MNCYREAVLLKTLVKVLLDFYLCRKINFANKFLNTILKASSIQFKTRLIGAVNDT